MLSRPPWSFGFPTDGAGLGTMWWLFQSGDLLSGPRKPDSFQSRQVGWGSTPALQRSPGIASPGEPGSQRDDLSQTFCDPSKLLPSFRPLVSLLSLEKEMASHSSILAKPMDRGAWRGVVLVGTQLSN